MGAALGRMLMIAKQNIGINKLYAFVDETNYVARNLLEQYAFDRKRQGASDLRFPFRGRTGCALRYGSHCIR